LNWQTLARVSPASLACVLSGGKLQYAEHWRKIDHALMRVARGDCRRLIINLPPQFGKSELISKHFPAWYLGEYPDRKIILVSYESMYASLWGMKAREIYREYSPHIFGSRLNDLKATTDWWFTSRDGYMATAGALGSITGKGAHVLIIDDPHKNASEAHSQLIREKVWDNYCSTFLTRLQPNGSVILIQTRWHEDDLTGRLLAREGDKWEKIILPALNDNGESLFPERFTSEEINERRETMGAYMFEALYQQRPTPRDGGMFKQKWWKFYSRLPERFDRVIQTWDLTFSGSGGSFVVGLVLGKVGSNCYVIDMDRDKYDFPEQVRRITQLSERYPLSTSKYIERKANGQAMIDTIKSRIHGIIPVDPKESKEARASAISYLIEAGNVFLPEHAPWKQDFIDEFNSFPNGPNDDIVDTLSQGLNQLYNKQQAVARMMAI
jgi:predicted phage terminase large subunit-like protein